MQPTLWFSILAGYGLGVAAAALLVPNAPVALALPVGIVAALLVVATVAAVVADRARSKRRPSPVVAAAVKSAERAAVPVGMTRAGGSDAAGDAGLSAAGVRRALDHGRIDIFVQPIVSLPQRRVAFYEASARIRDEAGELLPPAGYLPAAAESGLVGRTDRTLLFGCARVALHDHGAGRRIRVFCTVAPRSLEDPGFVSDAGRLLAAKPEFAQRLVLELDPPALDGAAWEGLVRLRRLGAGLCLDRPPAAGLDPEALTGRGIGFIRIGARRFEAAAGLHQRDRELLALHEALKAAGIAPIVDGIESERALIEVLDYPVRYGQGRLFGPPEPLAAKPRSLPAGTARAA